MWKLWLATGAVGVGVFVAVLVIGLRLTETETPHEPVRATVPVLKWGDRASALCRTAIRNVILAFAREVAAETDDKRSVRLYLETTALDGKLLEDLRAVPAAPADQADVDKAVGALEAQHDEDIRAGDQLRRRFDAALYRQAVDRYDKEAARVRPLFRALGAAGCARYLDPATYGPG